MRMQAMSQQSALPAPQGGSKEEMSPTAMSPHHGSMGSMGSPHHAGVKPGNQQTTQKPPPAVLQVVKQVKINKFFK
jgi:hypothetical protein